MTSAIIEARDLEPILSRVKILDATYGVPDAPGGFARAHIGDAQFFDIDAVADPDAPFAHTMPSPALFADAVGALGIGNDDDIVIYDQNGISFAAARAWWMFRVMGHDKVRVLNGGLKSWLEAGLPTQSGAPAAPAPKTFTAQYRAHLYQDFDDFDGGERIIDARSAPRFNAMMHTPDGDACPAHLPGSLNQPYDNLLEPGGARLKSADALAPILFPLIEPGSRMVLTCGSGVTACVLALGFYEAGYRDAAVYDGSWTEWSYRHSLR